MRDLLRNIATPPIISIPTDIANGNVPLDALPPIVRNASLEAGQSEEMANQMSNAVLAIKAENAAEAAVDTGDGSTCGFPPG